MATLGVLASLAQYGSSDSEITDSSEDEDTLEPTEDFILRILKNVIKESVRRVEYARSIKYRNKDEIDLEDSSSSDDESSDDDSSDFEGLILVNNNLSTNVTCEFSMGQNLVSIQCSICSIFLVTLITFIVETVFMFCSYVFFVTETEI